MTTTLYRARVMDTPSGDIGQSTLRSGADVGLLVRDGVIVRRADWATLRNENSPEYEGAEVVDLRTGVLLPGFVDTHVHYPQVRAIGGLGRPLLEWLATCALPEEARMAESGYAAAVAAEFVGALAASGTTSCMVFGAHFASAVDTLFTTAEPTGLRMTAGLVVGDRMLREDLHTTPERAYGEGLALAQRWHGQGRLRYAVTPRFSLATSEAMLASCGALLGALEGAWFTSHLNENRHEIEQVGHLCPDARDYLDTYDRHGLVTERSVFAHNVHPRDAELNRLAQAGSAVAHCPTSNAALGSGLFPLRAHLAAGVRVALGSDVGAGAGFGLLKEGMQAYFMQQLLGEAGLALQPADLLALATRAGAQALGLHEVGHLGEGMQFDAALIQPAAGSTLDIVLRHAVDDDDALAKIVVLGGTADIATVWVAGDPVVVPPPIHAGPAVPLSTSV